MYRAVAGEEHPDWDEYRRAMVDDRRLVGAADGHPRLRQDPVVSPRWSVVARLERRHRRSCVVVRRWSTQLVLVVRGVNVLVEDDGTAAPAAERVVRFFSYFTIQSNMLACVTALTLVRRPDRDGRWWRIRGSPPWSA